MKVQPQVRFGRLTALKRDETKTTPYIGFFWICACDCGNQVSVRSHSLRTGGTRSCGCLRSETTTRLKTKHGKRRTPEFDVWCNMRRRCFDPSNKSYADYGGRGITVCSRWKESFQNFIDDVGSRPSPNHQLDRINNFGNYEPNNVRWATRREQCNNRRRNSRYHFRGQSLTIRELLKFCPPEFRYRDLMERIRLKGWPIEDAISFPLGTRRRSAL